MALHDDHCDCLYCREICCEDCSEALTANERVRLNAGDHAVCDACRRAAGTCQACGDDLECDGTCVACALRELDTLIAARGLADVEYAIAADAHEVAA